MILKDVEEITVYNYDDTTVGSFRVELGLMHFQIVDLINEKFGDAWASYNITTL